MTSRSDEHSDGGAIGGVSLRGINKMKRQVLALGKEIIAIRNKGFSSITALPERNVFRGMHNSLDKVFEKFMGKWEEMLDYAEERELSFPTTEDTAFLEQVKTNYYDAVGYGVQLFSQPTGSNNTQTFNSSQSTITTSRAILPKIHIKPFKGDISLWPTFKQMFESLIMKDDSLSEAERFHYLVSFLDGPALDCIKHLPVIDINFRQAWEGLCNVYDNQRKLACTYLEKLLSFKPVNAKSASESLQLYLSNVTETVTSLQNLKIPNFEEYLLCELALRGLEPRSREAFELSMVNTKFPTFTALRDFIQKRCHALRMTEDAAKSQAKPSALSLQPHISVKSPNRFSKQSSQALLTTNESISKQPPPAEKPFGSPSTLSCYICKRTHIIADCKLFKQSTPAQRLELLKGFPGCRNCLHLFHKTKECTSKFSCRECSGRHHTDLHLTPKVKTTDQHNPNNQQPVHHSSSSSQEPSFVGASTSPSDQQGVLLGTVRACIVDSKGQPHQFRGLLDPGSQFSFITQDCAKKLGKSTRPYRGTISGVNSSHLRNIAGKASITFVPQSSSSLLETEAIVIPTITPPLPQVPLHSTIWQDYKSYKLSDPEFTHSQPISFLIGADLFTDVVTGSLITIHENGPRLIDTVFGFTVMGRFSYNDSSPHSLGLLSLCTTSDLIERFWKVEEPDVKPVIAPEDEKAEQHFLDHHRRTSSGRYMVSLPFKTLQPVIFPNVSKAISRFHALEAKFLKNPHLQLEYSAFMQEYLDLGHMSIATTAPLYVIPHHPVYKADNVGNQKLRVVFDASFRTPSGSLNEHLLTGPKLQADIGTIILNFRRFKYVILCDVVKMFRQILVHPDDRKYQQIVWRFQPTEPLRFYELNTVTYGLTSSPFQAQRVLHQLAIDEGQDYPAAAEVLLENTYIDDLVLGADTVEEILSLKADLVTLLSRGGFDLSKWKTNHPPLFAAESTSQHPVTLCSEEGATTKILGMSWDPTSDVFRYEVIQPQDGFSKRVILSVIARLSDPLGYLAPVVFHAKKILQETWKAGIGWDDPVPDFLKTRWTRFINDFSSLTRISIPRSFPISSSTYQLVCFCDASEDGYCAVAYLRSTHDTYVSLSLLKAKTRLAPLKPLTVPRLELCGAVLTAQLIKSLESVIKHYTISDTFCFSDSTVVLSWLRTPPHQLQTFVANRVQQVMDVTRPEWWFHVRGVDNPEDLGSRGVLPSELVNHNLWWSGPEWCNQPVSAWPLSQDLPLHLEVPELKPEKHLALAAVNQFEEFIGFTNRFSSFNKLIRVLAYVRRFITNSRIPKRKRRKRRIGNITSSEFDQAQELCISLVQHHHFPEVYRRDPQSLPAELKKLAIFIDHVELLRVGGRLVNAPLSTEHKHPVLLPARCHLTNLIIDHVHKTNFHAGPTAMLAFLRQRFWIPRARNLVRLHKSKCITCIRYSNVVHNPYMGNLPTSRFNCVRPFLNCGVDFAGPFMCRTSPTRRASVVKSYLCLFICLTSRAVHLELATTLSVESFLDVFDRFISRRGLPERMYSDCGTNFMGTTGYLRDVYQWFMSADHQSSIMGHTSHLGVHWSFNPPASPHMGGSWESHIKQAKHLMQKVFGNQSFTQPELSTMFTKVEAIMNSRPLQSVSDSPEDLEALTPGHFLIGQPLNALPEHDFTKIPAGRLSRWQLLRERVQHFWGRWKNEYLSSLQVRNKWTTKSPNLRIGDIVLLRDTNTSPCSWPLARVQEVHPGSDNIVRVVTIRTSRGTYKNSIVNLVALPVQSADATS